jgi:hypothetical protein
MCVGVACENYGVLAVGDGLLEELQVLAGVPDRRQVGRRAGDPVAGHRQRGIVGFEVVKDAESFGALSGARPITIRAGGRNSSASIYCFAQSRSADPLVFRRCSTTSPPRPEHQGDGAEWIGVSPMSLCRSRTRSAVSHWPLVRARVTVQPGR